MNSQRPVVIIGGGISGLVVARDLAVAGLPVLVLEAGSTFGGTVARHTVGGLELDAGAESFAISDPTVSALVTELGLENSVVAPHPGGAWVQHRGGAAPLPAGGLLGLPSSPWSADLRRVIGLPGTVRAGVDQWLPKSVGTSDGTLGTLVRRRLGRRVLDRLVEPVTGGVYSTDPDRLEVASINPRLLPALAEAGSLTAAVRQLRGGSRRPGAAVAGLRGGLYELVIALTGAIEAAGGQLRLQTPATALTSQGDSWIVEAAGEQLVADRVVVATPGLVAAGLVGRELSGGTATTDVLLVTLVLSAPALDARPRGTGVLVAKGAAGIEAKAMTHATAKWSWLADKAGPGTHVVRLSYGRGDATPPPTDPVGTALRDAAALFGVPLADPLDTAVTTWSATVPQPGPGHRAATSAWRGELPPGLTAVGTHLAGTGLVAVIADARKSAAALTSPVMT